MEDQETTIQPTDTARADTQSTHPTPSRAPARRGRRRFAAGLVALSITVATVATAGAHGLGDLVPTARTALARQPVAQTHLVASVDDVQNQAIQQVIQKGDEEQAQAIASRDPSVMADTSTSAYYQQLLQTNQDLLDNGVTAIQLLKLEWGAVDVNGGSATATVYETWSTTYQNGTTEVSRDRNDYTLVQDGATWKIKTDEHPDAQGGSGRTGPNPAPQQPQPPQPIVPNTPGDESTSHNWSGYAATGGSYTAVSGSWTVPQFTPDASFGMDATWVGIGGVRSRDLIQAGTQQVVSGSGATQYEAWIETLPQVAHPVALAIHPGDSVTVSLVEQSPNQWLVSFSNTTTGQTFQQNVSYNSSHSSAEWVEEAPSAGRGTILPLDDFGKIDFTGGSAVRDGQTVSIAASGARGITMLGASGQTLATPSSLGSDGASFSVTRSSAPADAQGVPARGFGRGGNGQGRQGSSRGFGQGGRGSGSQGFPGQGSGSSGDGFGFGFGS